MGRERAKDGERGDQHRRDQRRGAPALIPRAHPQPGVQADHRVRPGDDERDELPNASLGGTHEENPELERVVAVDSTEEAVCDPVVDDVTDKQDRDRETEHQLHQFGGAEPQAAPRPQRGCVAVPEPERTGKTKPCQGVPMLEIRNLVKHFGPLVAVDGVSFTVPRGEVLGFLGPNGAGKSTTMKMITGFLAPTAGTAIICGDDIRTRAVAAKRHIGYLPEGAPAYPDMTVREFLDFIARIRGYHGYEAKARVGRVVEMIHIGEVLNQPIETLSKGFRRRVGVAQALLHEPPVLILDEPTDGLDPNQKYEMRGIIAAMKAEKA